MNGVIGGKERVDHEIEFELTDVHSWDPKDDLWTEEAYFTIRVGAEVRFAEPWNWAEFAADVAAWLRGPHEYYEYVSIDDTGPVLWLRRRADEWALGTDLGRTRELATLASPLPFVGAATRYVDGARATLSAYGFDLDAEVSRVLARRQPAE